MISHYDYMQNKEKCEICGCTRFFSTSDYEKGITIQLTCGNCDAEYIRSEDTHHFQLEEKNMKKELELRMYFFVIYQLKGIQQGIQAGHAALEYAVTYGHTKLFEVFVDKYKTWIVLNGGTTNDSSDFEGFAVGSINRIVDSLETTNIDYAYFREPDLNDAITSVCFICDERVWNYEDYPDFVNWLLDIKMYEETKDMTTKNNPDLWVKLRLYPELQQEMFPEYYKEWVEMMGGKKNVFLRELIKNKKLV